MDAHEQIGRSHDAAFHGELALDAYRSAMELARGRDDQTDALARLARRASSLASIRGGSFQTLPDHAEIDALISEGLVAVRDPRERAALLIACADMATRWSVSGRPDPMGMDQRMAAAREAKQIAEEIEDATLAFAAADTMGDLKNVMGDYQGAARGVLEVLPLIDRIGSPAARAQAQFEASQSLLASGDPAGALDMASRSAELARHMSAHDQMHATSILMTSADWLGDWDAVESFLAEHLANFEQEANVHCVGVQSGPNRGALVVARRGERDRARSLAERTIPFEPTPGPIQSTAADVLVAVGDPAAGLAKARDVIERGPRWRQPEAVVAAIHALEAMEDWPALAQLASEIDLMRSASPYVEAHLDRAVGHSQIAAGNLQDGVAALRRAIETFDRIPVVFEAARTREALADAVPDERPALLESALATYERLGATPHVARVREKLVPNSTG
jgi:hypothetical protein